MTTCKSMLMVAALTTLWASSAIAQLAPGTYSIAADASDGILNMRSGPGQGHPIIVAVPAGAGGVVIGSCQRPDDGRSQYQWCQARWNGRAGWISSCCLVRTFAATPPVERPPVTTGPTPQSDPDAAARADFDLAKQYGVVEAWDAFLRKYPTGFLADLARIERGKLGGVATTPQAATPAPTPPPPAGTVVPQRPPQIVARGSGCGLYDGPLDRKWELYFLADAEGYAGPPWTIPPEKLTGRLPQFVKQLVERTLRGTFSETDALAIFREASRSYFIEFSYKGQPYEQIVWQPDPNKPIEGLIFAWGTTDVVAFQTDEYLTCNPDRRGDAYVAAVNLAPCTKTFDGKPALTVNTLKLGDGRQLSMWIVVANPESVGFPYGIPTAEVAQIEQEFTLNGNAIAIASSTLVVRLSTLGAWPKLAEAPHFRMLLDGRLLGEAPAQMLTTIALPDPCANGCETLVIEFDVKLPKPGTYRYSFDFKPLRATIAKGQDAIRQMVFQRPSFVCG